MITAIKALPVLRRPFGRSLDPLPDEDVGGYLLRLSAHLSIPPIALARQLGLVDKNGPHALRRVLITADLDEFARLTRLTPAEARRLTLLDWFSRYPPIRRAVGQQHPRQQMNWLYAATLRHCPSCLAGDGSTIQKRYGGAWRRVWRLPVAFACVEHRVFLSEGCGAPHALRLGISPLIPSADISGLHPVQCRMPRPGEHGRGSSPCGNRLDRIPGAAAVRPSSSHLYAQQQILDYLGPHRLPDRAAMFFADLRLIAAQLNFLRPGRWSAIDPAVRAAITDTIGSCVTQSYPTLDNPPRDVISVATILTAAVTILSSPERLARTLQLACETAGHPLRLRALERISVRYAHECTPALIDRLRRATVTR